MKIEVELTEKVQDFLLLKEWLLNTDATPEQELEAFLQSAISEWLMQFNDGDALILARRRKRRFEEFAREFKKGAHVPLLRRTKMESVAEGTIEHCTVEIPSNVVLTIRNEKAK